MNDPLSDVDARSLGSLIEKQMTTPDYYPLSLNALTAACNQTSNRDPVVQYDELTVMRSIEALRRRGLVRSIKRIDSRVTKFEHLAAEALNLEARDAALLAVLLLRGPQTAGELKTRSNRLFAFESVSDVEEALNRLAGRDPLPLVVRMPRRPGQKEARYAHLLSGDVVLEVTEPASPAGSVEPPVDRLSALEEETKELRKEVQDLRVQLEAFRRQFE